VTIGMAALLQSAGRGCAGGRRSSERFRQAVFSSSRWLTNRTASEIAQAPSLVVVGVDGPRGDAFRVARADFAGLRVEHIDAVNLDDDAVRFTGCSAPGDVRLAEHDEQVALAGVLQVVGHVQVEVHARLQDRLVEGKRPMSGVWCGQADRFIYARVKPPVGPEGGCHRR
jgi:hypothetical protein